MKIIDSHQHFWDPSRGDYLWMPKDDKILSRIYSETDLILDFKSTNVTNTVLVQAAATNNETEYMLSIADKSKIVSGVVGWINFENPKQLSQLKKFAKHPKFVGVRPMIQDIPDVNWMMNEKLDWAFKSIMDMNLTFDALGFPQHLENFLILAKKYSSLKIVIDHFMKPKISNNNAREFKNWATGISNLAELKNVYCKFSGIITEHSKNWKENDLKPYTDHILNVFGSERVMWGSDWPVCKLRAEYSEWFNTSQNLTNHLSLEEKENIFGKTAIKFYTLSL
jgi:L-fuconolactonase